jgi:hypothetical protein
MEVLVRNVLVPRWGALNGVPKYLGGKNMRLSILLLSLLQASMAMSMTFRRKKGVYLDYLPFVKPSFRR